MNLNIKLKMQYVTKKEEDMIHVVRACLNKFIQMHVMEERTNTTDLVRDRTRGTTHCLGIDHERFTVKHQGLDTKLTGVEKCGVIKDILS